MYRSLSCAHVTRPRPTPDHFRPLYRKLTALPARASDSSTRVLKRACSGSPDWWADDTLSPSGACTCAALHAARLRGDAPSVRHAGAIDARSAALAPACDGGSDGGASGISGMLASSRWDGRAGMQSGRKCAGIHEQNVLGAGGVWVRFAKRTFTLLPYCPARAP